MKIPRFGKLGIIAAATFGLAITGPSTARDRHKHHSDDDKVAGAIAGALVVGAIAAAASKKKRDRETYYRDGQRYYRDHQWGNEYHPANHTTCVRRIKKCYHRGHYSARWTAREFGYDRRY